MNIVQRKTGIRESTMEYINEFLLLLKDEERHMIVKLLFFFLLFVVLLHRILYQNPKAKRNISNIFSLKKTQLIQRLYLA